MTSATESISGGRGEEKENIPRTKLKKQKQDLEAKEAKEAKEIDKTCLARSDCAEKAGTEYAAKQIEKTCLAEKQLEPESWYEWQIEALKSKD